MQYKYYGIVYYLCTIKGQRLEIFVLSMTILKTAVIDSMTHFANFDSSLSQVRQVVHNPQPLAGVLDTAESTHQRHRRSELSGYNRDNATIALF